jgi:ribosomal RNA assembly protein
LLVPKDRIRVVMDSKAKGVIEKELGVKISFSDNLVEIEGEGIELFRAKDVVKAIGRGFSPKKAFRLFDEEEILDIIEMSGMKENKIRVIRSRLIGTKGKARRLIERFSGCSVSVYGKTVSMIGKYEQITIAKGAAEMIIRGSKHSKVYGFLQSQK